MKITYRDWRPSESVWAGDIPPGGFFVPVPTGTPVCIMLTRYPDKCSVGEMLSGGVRFCAYDTRRLVYPVEVELVVRPREAPVVGGPGTLQPADLSAIRSMVEQAVKGAFHGRGNRSIT